MGIQDSITNLELRRTFRDVPNDLRSHFVNLLAIGDWNRLVKICLDYLYAGADPTKDGAALNLEAATELALVLRELAIGNEEADGRIKYLYLFLDSLVSHEVVKEAGFDQAQFFGMQGISYSAARDIAETKHRYENGFFGPES